MKLVARDMDQRARGREEGWKEGLQEGLQQGLEEGEQNGILKSIRRLLANHLSPEEVKHLLDVTDEDIRMAQKK